MKTPKKSILFLLIAVMVSVSVFAQRGDGRRQTPEERARLTVERMGKQLELPADKQQQLLPIYSSYFQEMHQLSNQDKTGRGKKPSEETMAKKKALRENHETKLQATLTQAQFSKYQQLKEAHKQRARQQKRSSFRKQGPEQKNN